MIDRHASQGPAELRDEFDAVDRYFRWSSPRDDVLLGVGDDAAVLRPPAGSRLLVSTDTLVAGVHFPADTDPDAIGHKALAVNLSDLAAMGAVPAWATLSLTLPDLCSDWLEAFSHGFRALAENHRVALVGGDMSRGPLSVSVQVMGLLAAQEAPLRRSGARPGDQVYVTGTLGDAALGLRLLADPGRGTGRQRQYLLSRLHRPSARVDEGRRLRSVARAAIDISDGLAADLGHICRSSDVGARIWVDRLPFSSAMQALTGADERVGLALTGGDDYELCVSAAPGARSPIEDLGRSFACGLTAIGVIEAEPGLRCVDGEGRAWRLKASGYRHFGSDRSA